MPPAPPARTCPVCGDSLGDTKNSATHHRRFCRTRLAERLTRVVEAPLGFEIVGPDAGVPGGTVRLAGSGTECVVRTFDAGGFLTGQAVRPAGEAATTFLAKIRPVG